MKILHTIRNEYDKLKAPIKASLWFVICGFFQKGISMITTPIFTRIMTEAEYGRYNVYISWFQILQILVSLNLASGVYMRGLVKNKDDENRFTSSMMGLSTSWIIGCFLVYICFSGTINRLIGLSTLLMGAIFVEIWSTAAYQFWSSRNKNHYRYKALVIVTFLYTTLRPIVGVICVKSVAINEQVEARAISASIITFLFFVWIYIYLMRKGGIFFIKKYWIYGLTFNLPLIPHYLSQIVLNQADRLMINSICGANYAAYYSVAYVIANTLQILNSSITSTMSPWMYRAIDNKEYSSIGKVSYSILGLIAILNLLIIAIAPEIMKIMAPSNYSNAIWVIPPVTASVYFMFLYNLFAVFEYYFEKTNYIMISSVIAAVLNIILNAVFIPRFGYIAAGYTTLFCYIVYSFAHYYFMRKVIKKNIDGDKIIKLSVVLKIGIAVLLFSTVLMLLYNYPIIRLTVFTIMILVLIMKRKWIIEQYRIINRK